MTRRLLLLPALALVLLLGVSCGDDDAEEGAGGDGTTSTVGEETTTSEPDTTTTAEETTSTTESVLEPVGEGSSDPVESDAFQEGPTAYLEAVRVAGQVDFERVVFEFAEETPEYRIEYVDQAPAGPSGQPADISGNSYLRVHMAPASAVDLSGTEPEETYTGPDVVSAATTTVVDEVGLVEDFEANLVWAIGVDEQVPFAVERLEGPPRLVIDLIR